MITVTVTGSIAIEQEELLDMSIREYIVSYMSLSDMDVYFLE